MRCKICNSDKVWTWRLSDENTYVGCAECKTRYTVPNEELKEEENVKIHKV